MRGHRSHAEGLEGRRCRRHGPPMRSRNHLPADAQVPAGFGTSPTRLRAPSGCPGIKGPVPPPVLMDGASVGIAEALVNRFIRMKRFI